MNHRDVLPEQVLVEPDKLTLAIDTLAVTYVNKTVVGVSAISSCLSGTISLPLMICVCVCKCVKGLGSHDVPHSYELPT